MTLGVFLHRIDSVYDDSPAEQYQFPRIYLSRAEACVADWIVYLEPTKVRATRGYFAAAKVQRVIVDPANSKMYLAVIEPGTYLDFANPVPFRGPDGVTETGLLDGRGRVSARAQWAVRPLSAADFNWIINRGLDVDAALLPRNGADGFSPVLNEQQSPFELERYSDRRTVLASRIVRDRVFRKVVLDAYDSRCAITGLKLINGNGRAEVEAAHIRSVEANGPDIICNGLALSGTAHWMFDRGLLTIDDDLKVLVSSHVNDFQGVIGMINKTGRVLPTLRPNDRPHPHFLRWHRETRFKGIAIATS